MSEPNQTSAASENSGSRDQPVRWGIISTANIGAKALIPAILTASNSQLVAIASRNRVRAQSLAASLAPQPRAYGSYDELLDDPEIEAVYIPLPNSQHKEWTIRAAARGKHVLCEKPLALTADDTREMIAACRASNVVLLEAFMYRFHPQIQWVAEQVRSGRIGEVHLVRGSFAFDIRQGAQGRAENIRLQAALGGGSLLDVGCYPLNFARLVYSAEPITAHARVTIPAGSEVERTATAILDFGTDRLALIDCSFEQPWHQRAEVVGDRGRIVVERPFTPGMSDALVTVVAGDEATERRFTGLDQYRLQVEHFARCVRDGGALATEPEDATANMAAIEMIYRAAGYEWPRSQARSA